LIGTGFIGGRPAWAVSNRNPAFVADYTTLRGLNTNAMVAFITGLFSDAESQLASGWFIRDDNDTTSPDNGGTIIVASNGKRWKRIFDGNVDALWFGVDTTGVVNSTTALLNFFNYCVNNEIAGHIPGGTYKVTTGVLKFDCNFLDKVWPDITTDGHEAVTFVVDDTTATDEPILELTNGTATSPAGRYWLGGSLGGITFEDDTADTAPNRHAIRISGVWGTKFGWMRGNDLRGSLFCHPEALYNTNNPDPYAITFCSFAGIEVNRCVRYGLENQNWVGFNGCSVEFLRVIEGGLGGWFGLGAGNVCDFASMGTVAGWAFDDGTAVANTGGSPSRFTLGLAELDDVQNGFRINKLTASEFKQVRFVHRYNFSVLNPGEGYWPRKAVEIGGGAAPANNDIQIQMFHRIEAGGVKADMGEFLDLSNISSTNIKVSQRVIDNAGFGFLNSDLYTNLNTNGSQLLTNDGTIIANTMKNNSALSVSDGTAQLGAGSYGAAASKIAMLTEVYDGVANMAAGEYTVPYSGLYHVTLRFAAAAAVGTRFRYGFLRNRGGGLTVVIHRTTFVANAAAQNYEVSGTLDLIAGDIVYPIGDNNTGLAIVCTPITSNAADNVFQVRAL
jgi:hypothetical protein